MVSILAIIIQALLHCPGLGTARAALLSQLWFPDSDLLCEQEISFFEEGEPLIDGEPGDLKVTICLVSVSKGVLRQIQGLQLWVVVISDSLSPHCVTQEVTVP